MPIHQIYNRPQRQNWIARVCLARKSLHEGIPKYQRLLLTQTRKVGRMTFSFQGPVEKLCAFKYGHTRIKVWIEFDVFANARKLKEFGVRFFQYCIHRQKICL